MATTATLELPVITAPLPAGAARDWHAPFRLAWGVLFGITAMHLGALAAPWTCTWAGFWVLMVLQWLTGGLGICLCYHRLLTHRSLQVPKLVEYLLAFCGCLAMQGGPTEWVATHRLHHASSDRPEDPHSPTRGFWWAHMGWLFVHDERRGSFARWKVLAPDIAADPFYRFLDRTFVLWQVLLGAALWAWGGWSLVIWGICLRAVFVYHSTWLVNSAAHIWGYRSYATGDLSTNSWWVALLTYGEGWHNNHHAFLRSARHGLRWWEVDVTYWTIRALGWFKLARKIWTPPKTLLTAKPASTQAKVWNTLSVPAQ